jgi:uncharacterized protein
MKLGGRERMDDGAALEELFAKLSVSADWTIGFFTAVLTGPDPVPPERWTAEVVPKGTLDDDPTARTQVDTLTRLYAAVAETLRTTPEIIPPEPDKTAQEAGDFCRGYSKGVSMHPTWSADTAATEKLVPFEAIAKQENVDPAHRENLGKSVAEIYSYWQSKRQVVHTTPKVGRNDPCPCGSGKKHKKCCLAKEG